MAAQRWVDEFPEWPRYRSDASVSSVVNFSWSLSWSLIARLASRDGEISHGQPARSSAIIIVSDVSAPRTLPASFETCSLAFVLATMLACPLPNQHSDMKTEMGNRGEGDLELARKMDTMECKSEG